MLEKVSKDQQGRDLPKGLIISTTPQSSHDSHNKSTVLQKMEVGYQLRKGGSRTNHLMFMDGI